MSKGYGMGFRALFVLVAAAYVGLSGLAPVLAEEQVEAVRDAREVSRAFEHAARVITPALVNISSVQNTQVRRGQPMVPRRNPNDPFFDFFSDDFFERFFGERGPEQFRQRGMGSGFIIDTKGHIITNEHVVRDADTIEVKLHDGRVLKAKVVGSDPRTDIAVIKVEAKDLQPAKLGDSDKLHIGEWVVAAGNPFGLDHTITTGIVSARGRSLMGGMQYEDFIQTDAAINPGNSGGPLVNLNGEVVGINSAIFTRSGGYMGIGFAIPINMARNVVAGLLEHGRLIRGWLVVVIQDLTDDLAASFGVKMKEGVLVGDVSKDGPAAAAGIKAEDIIVSFDGQAVNDVTQLRNAVAAIQPGKKVKVDLLREGRRQSITVKIGELESAEAKEAASGDPTSDLLGLELQPLTPELAQRLNARAGQGVVVTAVSPTGLAGAVGLRRGDVITNVQGQEVSSPTEFRKELERHDLKKGVRLSVESQGLNRFVIIKED